MNRAEIQRRIQERLASGELPLGHPEQTWGGLGTSQTCAICDEVIGSGSSEIEAQGADKKLRYYHLDCYAALLEERNRPR